MSATYAILISTIAGLCTGIGGLISLAGKSNKAVCIALSFSAGVMLYISMTELLPDGLRQIYNAINSHAMSEIASVLSFMIGIIAMHIMKLLLPSEELCFELDHTPLDLTAKIKAKHRRLGIMSAIAIALHNFPEGMITFVTALSDSALALPVVIAIALHNIPEGVAVSSPIYYATGSKIKTVSASLLSGLAEPLGALLAYLVLAPILSPLILGIMLSCVAGIMLYISIFELLPSAWQLNYPNLSTYATLAGMITMALSLILLG